MKLENFAMPFVKQNGGLIPYMENTYDSTRQLQMSINRDVDVMH